ncbi:ATP-binding protein [Jiella sp. M17.18]|uniref:ATP-binding protein n=1 Tax=Jiella sp. M17.18 TaxID=3234247 RepID=UPI0034DF2EB7
MARRTSHLDDIPDQFAGIDVDAIISRRRGERRREISEILSRVKFSCVESTRDVRFAEAFDEAVDEMLIRPGARPDDADFEEPRDGRPVWAKPEGFIFFVTGESGAGKTFMIRRYLERSEVFQPIVLKEGTIDPVVSVRAPSPCTLQRLGLRILRAMGDNPKVDLAENRVWERITRLARARRVKLVHIDEAQHLARTLKSVNEQQAVANALKDLAEQDGWPVSFVLSGIPLTNVISQVDPQIERRSFYFTMPSLVMDRRGDRRIVETVLQALAVGKAGLELDGSLGADFVDRIAHAANYQVGRCAQIVRFAIHAGLKRDHGVLARQDFVEAYRQHSQARGLDRFNVFDAEHWQMLEPGTFIIPEEDE